MNPEIEKLIKLAIADGEITEKERGIILRKAEKFGEDKDEVEMIIDGEIALAFKEQNNNQLISNSVSTKEGNIKKCPACGAPVPSMAMKCNECDHEFRNTEASQSAQDFYKQLKSANTKDRALIISNFPVPNTKEDLIEFITLATGNSRELSVEERNSYLINAFKGTYKPELHFKESEIKAWQAKAEAAILKARLMFSDNVILIEQLNKYEESYNANKNFKRTRIKEAQKVPLTIFFSLAIVITIILLLMFLLIIFSPR